jgi:DNA-binding Lrp family transcriptional regulator
MEAYLGLTCKEGNFTEVLKRLLFKLFIDQQDIYVLNSPIDVLVRLNGVSTVEEFITRWFNPIRNVVGQDDLITKMQSFIVISGSPIPLKKPSAFVFINAQTKRLENVRTDLLTIPEVLSADSVLGCYDVIGSVEAKSKSDCNRIVSKIERISGIVDSTASFVDETEVFPDW